MFVKRDANQKIVEAYGAPQPDQPNLEHVSDDAPELLAFNAPGMTQQQKRAAEYPAVVDQLYAVTKFIQTALTALPQLKNALPADAQAVFDKIAAVKQKYPVS